MFDCRAQFPEIRIIGLSIVLQDSTLSFRGSAPNPASITLSLAERPPTFTMASQSPVQNKNVHTEDANDLMARAKFCTACDKDRGITFVAWSYCEL